jgi:hypothetical protein
MVVDEELKKQGRHVWGLLMARSLPVTLEMLNEALPFGINGIELTATGAIFIHKKVHQNGAPPIYNVGEVKIKEIISDNREYVNYLRIFKKWVLKSV